eukprot:338369-Chlamydomonas_euryale.AAC.1
MRASPRLMSCMCLPASCHACVSPPHVMRACPLPARHACVSPPHVMRACSRLMSCVMVGGGAKKWAMWLWGCPLTRRRRTHRRPWTIATAASSRRRRRCRRPAPPSRAPRRWPPAVSAPSPRPVGCNKDGCCQVSTPSRGGCFCAGGPAPQRETNARGHSPSPAIRVREQCDAARRQEGRCSAARCTLRT